MRPLLFWLLAFVTPASIVAQVLQIYLHEFAHGLTALATGGHFLGVGKYASEYRGGRPYADAWSDYDLAVLLAGISVNVTIGLLLLWWAFRTKPVRSRLFLFLFASYFLSELNYALEGCLFPNGDSDTAEALNIIELPAFRWIALGVISVLLCVSICIVSRGCFRAWEEVFGELSPGKAFWVILLLVAPVPLPSIKDPEAPWHFPAAMVVLICVTVWLIRSRRRQVTRMETGRYSAWGLGLGGAMVVALLGMVQLIRGIELGTFIDQVVWDLHPDQRTIAGVSVRYGMDGRDGFGRPVKHSELFVSTPEGFRQAHSPDLEVNDLAWLPDLDRFLVVTSWGLYEADPSTKSSTLLWRPPWGQIESARHGPGGEMVVMIKRFREARSGIYAYDPRRAYGEFHEASGEVGTPVFEALSPPRAAVTIGEDLWEITWPSEFDEEIQVHRLKGESGNRWISGFSGERKWWFDTDAWMSGEIRVANQAVAHSGAGDSGFFVLKEKGGWERTTPEGDRSVKGVIDTPSVKLLQFLDGVPWVAFDNGDIRRLEEQTPAFKVKFPP